MSSRSTQEETRLNVPADAEAERLRLHAASEWWLRLQEDASPELASEWLTWTEEQAGNLDAFNRIESMAFELRKLDVAQRVELLCEFGPKRARRPAPLALAAAACCAVVGLGYIAANWLDRVTSVGGQTLYATDRSVHRDITLDDGSQLTVGASSAVAVHMDDVERLVQLRDGEAYFEVQKDSRRPFVVDAGEVSVTAVGTAFNVRRTHDNVVVSVTEGRVRITRPQGSAFEVQVGERAAYDAQARRFRLSTVKSASAIAWREGRLEFVNEPLDVVIANINRYAQPGVAIADPAIGALTFTGTVLPNSLPAWLNALPSVLPVRIEQHTDQVVIHAAH